MKNKPFPELANGGMLLSNNNLYMMIMGNAGTSLVDISDTVVGVSDVVKHFKLTSPMVVTRWVKVGLPHFTIAGRRAFRLDKVKRWLKKMGYETDALIAGQGLVSARNRNGDNPWHKGQMSITEKKGG